MTRSRSLTAGAARRDGADNLLQRGALGRAPLRVVFKNVDKEI